jgi:AhpD family alkylhydroperoxidase
MSQFPLYSIDSAPQKSKPVLLTLQQAFGFIPNIAGAMAGSPVLINSFISVFQNVHCGSFNERQIQTLLLTNAVANACSWAVAFHTALALKEGMSGGDVEAIRCGALPAEPDLAALSALSRHYIEKRGKLADDDLKAFLAAGFTPEHALEIITVVAASTITNYVGNAAQPPLETAFQEHAWQAIKR